MPGTTLSLDDLVALNQQIAALARVGAPLEGGLRQFANETPGRDKLGRYTRKRKRPRTSAVAFTM